MSTLPRIILKAAISLDGFLDDSSPNRKIFSTREDREAVAELRKGVDAIFVGAETVRKDNPELKVDLSVPPLRVTASRSMKFDLTLKFLNRDDAGFRSLIYTSGEAPEASRQPDPTDVEIIRLPSKELQLREIFADLYTCKGVRTLLVEGGSRIIRQVIENDLADELRIAISPELLGKVGGARFYTGDLTKKYHLKEIQNLGGMSVLHLYR